MLLISLLIITTSKGPIIYWSKRVGKNNKIFAMPKFRSMLVKTPDVATHLLKDHKNYLTPIGGILRHTSLDELPQFFSVLKGDMSIVGPRPALHNQKDLVELRTIKKIHFLLPGITGLAQTSGRDDLSIIDKVKFDEQYLVNKSLKLDFKIILNTIFYIIKRKDISH